MRKQSIFVLILLLFGVGSAFAQKVIKGTISSDGVTMPGTNIQVKEAPKVVAISDVNGNFTITVPENGKTLVFSFVGMKTKEVAIGNTTNFNIKMEPTVQQMKEVTITAIGIPREKKSLGYASQVVKSDEIGGSHEMSTVNSLQGKVAGLNITNSSGAVGGSSKITLRGASSFTGNNSPLFVVNGVPVDNDFRVSRTGSPNYGNPISDINPDDIESINVLKGPVAAALYGSKAMNGAIIITTKTGKGEKGKNSDFLVSYNTGYSFDHVLRLPEFQNSYGQGYEGDNPVDGNGFMAADESWGAPLDGRSYIDFMGKPAKWVPQPNNIKDFFVNGHQFENGISIASGDDKGSVRLSLSTFNQKGTMPNTGFDKYTAGLNIDRKLTSRLSTEIGINYTLSKGLNRPGVGYDTYNPLQSLFGWFGRQVDMQELKDNDNSIDPTTGLQYNWNTRYHNNPYWTLYNNLNKDRRDRVISNAKLNYKISDWLSAAVRGGSDFYVESRFQQFKKGTIDYSYMRTGGFYDDPTKQNTANLDAMLVANKRIEDKFSITGTLGYNFFRNSFQSSNTEVRGLIVPDIYNVSYAATPPIVTTNKTEKEIAGFYGLASFGYKDYLFLDVTGRNDWSSTLPSNNRSYFYPSVSGSFIFSELMKEQKWLSFGKFRAGYAAIGNDTDPYALNSYKQKLEIGTDPSIISNPFNGAVYLTQENILRNDKLKPETGKSFELGTDVRFLDSRLGLDVTYYNTTTKDIIVPVSLPASSGYTSTVINAGKINNQGIEIMLNTVPVKTAGGFIWNMNLNFSKNKGKILEIANGLDKILLDADWADLYLVKGRSYGTLYGHGVLTDGKGNLLVDADGHLIADPNPQILGDVTPNFRLGFENSFTFKNFTFGFLIDWQDGGKVFSQTNMWMDYSGLSKRTEDRPDGGLVNQGMVATPDANGNYVSTGQANTTAISPEAYWEEYAWENWKNYTYDASFVKLRQIDISYSLPESILKKTPFSKLEIGIYARNLWLIYSKMPYMDPEVNSSNSRNASGFESNAVPSSRSIGFNLKIVF